MKTKEIQLCPDCPLTTAWKREAVRRLRDRQYTNVQQPNRDRSSPYNDPRPEGDLSGLQGEVSSQGGEHMSADEGDGRDYCPKCEKWLDAVIVIRGDRAEWNKESKEYEDEEAQMWWQHRCPTCDTVVDGGQS